MKISAIPGSVLSDIQHAETIDLVAVLSGRGSARRLTELARVEGIGPDGDYRITQATPSIGDPS